MGRILFLIHKCRRQFVLSVSIWLKRYLFLSTFCKVRSRTPRMLSKYSTSEEICGLVNQIVNEALYSKKYQMSFSTRSLEGMSGQRFRKLLNKLICDLNVTKYLEIGTFRGSTAISALYRNDQCRGLLVDNLSQFGAEKRKLISNLNKFKILSRVNLIDSDFRECIQDLKNFSPKVFSTMDLMMTLAMSWRPNCLRNLLETRISSLSSMIGIGFQ